MTLAHFVYIPVVLLVGAVIGYILGGRAALSARAETGARANAREARRLARERGEPRRPG